MLECLNNTTDDINIYDFVSKIRSQRAYLVQTLRQYMFIHDALDEYCTFGFTDIKPQNLANFYSIQHENELLKKEYQMLNVLDHQDLEESRLLLSENDYILAEEILDNFIVTSDPTKSTVIQFWKMVIEYNSNIIISLNNNFETVSS